MSQRYHTRLTRLFQHIFEQLCDFSAYLLGIVADILLSIFSKLGSVPANRFRRMHHHTQHLVLHLQVRGRIDSREALTWLSMSPSSVACVLVGLLRDLIFRLALTLLFLSFASYISRLRLFSSALSTSDMFVLSFHDDALPTIPPGGSEIFVRFHCKRFDLDDDQTFGPVLFHILSLLLDPPEFIERQPWESSVHLILMLLCAASLRCLGSYRVLTSLRGPV